MTASATLMLHLTGRCNLECQHCYMEGSPRRRQTLPMHWVQDALREAPGLGIDSVYLTGGEPLLYPKFDEIARTAFEVGGLTTTVCTNATLVRRKEAELLSALRFDVHVSIDGDQRYHDGFRQVAGAYKRAERGVGLLIEMGVPVTIVTTISQANLEQFPRIAQWALDMGAKRLMVQPLLDLGRAASIQDQRLSTEQLNLLILQTSDFANGSGGRIRASIVGASKRFLLAHPCAAYVCNGGGCHRGVSAEIKKIVVREDGTILPEATNLDHRYAIGTVMRGPLGAQIKGYFAERYQAFDRLCRTTYDELVPDWPDAVVPWDQLLAHRSQRDVPVLVASAERVCDTSAPSRTIYIAPRLNPATSAATS